MKWSLKSVICASSIWRPFFAFSDLPTSQKVIQLCVQFQDGGRAEADNKTSMTASFFRNDSQLFYSSFGLDTCLLFLFFYRGLVERSNFEYHIIILNKHWVLLPWPSTFFAEQQKSRILWLYPVIYHETKIGDGPQEIIRFFIHISAQIKENNIHKGIKFSFELLLRPKSRLFEVNRQKESVKFEFPFNTWTLFSFPPLLLRRKKIKMEYLLLLSRCHSLWQIWMASRPRRKKVLKISWFLNFWHNLQTD